MISLPATWVVVLCVIVSPAIPQFPNNIRMAGTRWKSQKNHSFYLDSASSSSEGHGHTHRHNGYDVVGHSSIEAERYHGHGYLLNPHGHGDSSSHSDESHRNHHWRTRLPNNIWGTSYWPLGNSHGGSHSTEFQHSNKNWPQLLLNGNGKPYIRKHKKDPGSSEEGSSSEESHLKALHETLAGDLVIEDPKTHKITGYFDTKRKRWSKLPNSVEHDLWEKTANPINVFGKKKLDNSLEFQQWLKSRNHQGHGISAPIPTQASMKLNLEVGGFENTKHLWSKEVGSKDSAEIIQSPVPTLPLGNTGMSEEEVPKINFTNIEVPGDSLLPEHLEELLAATPKVAEVAPPPLVSTTQFPSIVASNAYVKPAILSMYDDSYGIIADELSCDKHALTPEVSIANSDVTTSVIGRSFRLEKVDDVNSNEIDSGREPKTTAYVGQKQNLADVLPKFKMYKQQLQKLITRMAPHCPEVHGLKLLRAWMKLFRDSFPNFVEMSLKSMNYSEDLKLQLALCYQRLMNSKFGYAKNGGNSKSGVMDNQIEEEEDDDEGSSKVKRSSVDMTLLSDSFQSELAIPIVNFFANLPDMVERAQTSYYKK